MKVFYHVSIFTAALALGIAATLGAENLRQHHPGTNTSANVTIQQQRPPSQARQALPPLPDGVTELKFADFYRQPIGPRGLEYSDTLKSLDGKRVRILGYMVRQSAPVPWTFLLSPAPAALHESEYGFSEDLPATVLHVKVTRGPVPVVPYTPGPLLLTGILNIGNQEEADGRISSVRLHLDPPTPGQRHLLAELASAGKTNSTTTVPTSKTTP